ncbi:uncharacterized protein [Manis javanica]|uniref:uncharacterized protein n=1 Tax=Manis javanica TaxID=9974 RepID=UPI003C6D7D30
MSPSWDIIFRSLQAPHNAVGGSTDTGLGPTPDFNPDTMGMMPPLQPSPTGLSWPQTRLWATEPPASSLPSTTMSPMDTMLPSTAITYRSPPAPHEGVGSTTADLLPNSNAALMGCHLLLPPSPTQCCLLQPQTRPMTVYRGFISSYAFNNMGPYLSQMMCARWTRAAGRRAAALTTRSRTSPAHGCPSWAHLLRSLPSRAAPPAERADSQPPARPSEPTTRVGRFPAPRATRCPPSHLHGRPLVRLHRALRRRQGVPAPRPGPAVPRGHVPSNSESRRCRLHPSSRTRSGPSTVDLRQREPLLGRDLLSQAGAAAPSPEIDRRPSTSASGTLGAQRPRGGDQARGEVSAASACATGGRRSKAQHGPRTSRVHQHLVSAGPLADGTTDQSTESAAEVGSPRGTLGATDC